MRPVHGKSITGMVERPVLANDLPRHAEHCFKLGRAALASNHEGVEVEAKMLRQWQGEIYSREAFLARSPWTTTSTIEGVEKRAV